LVQDTFVRAIESYRIFDPPTNMRAWLTNPPIARWKARQHPQDVANPASACRAR